ncbi:MAG: aminotransferase class I/II-fold pyridoxal phosphate-dependent enzyme, partial [Actinobacteria bacterium]|nr:aminotransferase class I/II-fold pyridoxal phosphate-dependent enzyme [Actinomycetota bacterium]
MVGRGGTLTLSARLAGVAGRGLGRLRGRVDGLADLLLALVQLVVRGLHGLVVVAGERQVHRDLEQALAKHYTADDAVVMVSGYATNLGVIGQLVGPKDLIVYDAVSHNSVVMGSVLYGATRRSFAHN